MLLFSTAQLSTWVRPVLPSESNCDNILMRRGVRREETDG